MFDKIEASRLNELHIKYDEESQLHAIVAIHNTRLGPALGGCRMIEYDNDESALQDAINLSRSMSYKAALAGLELGGGKSVILKPKKAFNRNLLLTRFGEFINELSGRYITAIDCGTSIEDMDIIHNQTPYVRGTSFEGDPSFNTAVGVFLGIKSCVQHKLKTHNLKGIHVAIQGLGKVGYTLALLLHEQGAKLTVCDLNPALTKKAHTQLNAEVIPVDKIYDVSCDIFAPCGLGGIINDKTISRLNCAIIAGSANNQLATPELGLELYNQEILYAPDYVINSGGLIFAALRNQHSLIENKTENIPKVLYKIFDQSSSLKTEPSEIASQIAEKILYQ